jgi:hypothetical protein
VQALWLKNSSSKERDKQLAATVAALVGIAPEDELEGMIARAPASRLLDLGHFAFEYEFYACFDLPHRIDKLQPLVDAFAHRFNHHRPHQALGARTPAEYLKAISARDSRPSHMS